MAQGSYSGNQQIQTPSDSGEYEVSYHLLAAANKQDSRVLIYSYTCRVMKAVFSAIS